MLDPTKVGEKDERMTSDGPPAADPNAKKDL